MHNKSLTIQIAGKKYPVRLTPEEELVARVIEKEVNAKIDEFQSNYAIVDKQDVLAMVLLTYAFDAHQRSEQNHVIDLEKKIATLEKLIDSAVMFKKV